MKDWPRLPTEAHINIETAERQARKIVSDQGRPYSPANPQFRLTFQNIFDGGVKVIDHICEYAEAVFDANAKEYLRLGPASIRSSTVLKQWVGPQVERSASNLWGAWLFAAMSGRPQVLRKGEAGMKPGNIVVDAPLLLAKRGIAKVVVTPRDKTADARLASVIPQLQERFIYQIQLLLKARIRYWSSELRQAKGGRSPQSKASAGDPLVAQRRQLLADYKAATGNPSNKSIYSGKSGIHKPEFYKWIKGSLSDKSETARNFERILRAKKPLALRKPQD